MFFWASDAITSPSAARTYLCVVPPLVCLLRLQIYQLFRCQLNPQDACNLLGLFQMLNLVLEHEQSDNCNWFTQPLAKNTVQHPVRNRMYYFAKESVPMGATTSVIHGS